MVSGAGDEEENVIRDGASVADPSQKALRLVGYLKANRKAAYVLAVMVAMHLSNQFDRWSSTQQLLLLCVAVLHKYPVTKEICFCLNHKLRRITCLQLCSDVSSSS